MKLPEMLKKCFRDADCESIINARTLDTFSFYSQLVFPHLTDDVWDDPVKHLQAIACSIPHYGLFLRNEDFRETKCKHCKLHHT
jgi:hypothetical protein